MKRGEIYLADLEPVKGSEQKGTRPVVIISGSAMNRNIDLVIACPLTTAIKNYAGCIVLKKNSYNKLTNDSEVITFQLRAISKSRLIKKLGEITNDELKKIIAGLNDILKY